MVVGRSKFGKPLDDCNRALELAPRNSMVYWLRAGSLPTMKTNAMRILDALGIHYDIRKYEEDSEDDWKTVKTMGGFQRMVEVLDVVKEAGGVKRF